jgi:polysaccharide biosynthesis protein PslH
VKSLRIVLVLTAAPLAFGSAAGRWFSVMLRGLPARGHRLTTFVPCGSQKEMEDVRRLFPSPAYDVRCFEYARLGNVASKLAAYRRPQSYIFSRDFQGALDRELAIPYDVLQFESQWCGWLAPSHRARTIVNLLDLFRVDCAGQRPAALRDRLRFDRTWNAEAQLLRSFSWIAPLSSEMRNEVQSLNPEATFRVVPLGMELANYPFNSIPSGGDPIVTLIGTFDWLPTRMAADRLLARLWPAIRTRVPRAQLHLVGRNVRAAVGDQLGITIFENVPDIIPYFRKASVLLYAPERGSGMKVKVLESFALGLPVVTTKAGVEGIPAVDGIHAGISEDDNGLIERCVALLENREAQIRQRANARDLLEKTCAADVALDALEALYKTMLT